MALTCKTNDHIKIQPAHVVRQRMLELVERRRREVLLEAIYGPMRVPDNFHLSTATAESALGLLRRGPDTQAGPVKTTTVEEFLRGIAPEHRARYLPNPHDGRWSPARMVALWREHPGWTAAQVAEHFGISPEWLAKRTVRCTGLSYADYKTQQGLANKGKRGEVVLPSLPSQLL